MDTIRLSPKLVLAFGLSWEQHDPYGLSQHAQIQKWRSAGFDHAASYKHPGGRVYGLVRPTGKASGKGLVSGAICIATHPSLTGKTGLVLIEFEQENRTAVVAVGLRNGVVVLDRIIGTSEVSDVRNAFLKQLGAGEAPQTWGSLHSSAPTDHAFELRDLAPGRNHGIGAPITALRSARWPLLLGAVTGTTVLATVAWQFWTAHQESQHRLQLLKSLEGQTPAVLYGQAVTTWLNRPVVLLGDGIAAVRERFQRFPVLHAGWVLDTVSCSSLQCQVHWSRKDGTLGEFRATAPADWLAITAVDQNHIDMAIDLPLPPSKLDRSRWPQATEYRDALVGHWQYLTPGGWSAQMGAVSQMAIPANFTSEQRQAIASDPDAPLGFEVSAQNQMWWYASADTNSPVAAERMGTNVEMTAPIDLKFDGGNILFAFKGTAYVHR